MDCLALLKEAQADGISVEVVNGDLKIRASADKEHWAEKLHANKFAIIEHITGELAEAGPSDESPELYDAYQPFPVTVFPSPISDYIQAAADAIGCDPSFIALPMLACLAQAIGNKRVIRLKHTWQEPPNIWAGIIGNSGTHKTPALQAATKFLHQLQSEALAEHSENLSTYEIEFAQYEKEFSQWKRKKSDEQPPWKPEEPKCTRFITSDCTIEALASLLAEQFDGLLVFRDELSGWFNGIAEYKGGKGSDLGHWLACWSSKPLIVDRKTGTTKHINVPRASVNLVGGIQPGIMRSVIGREHLQDGLCARLLFAMPDSKPVVWSEAIVAPENEVAVYEVFKRLLELESALDAQNFAEPYPLDLTAEAKAVWIDYYNRHQQEMDEFDDDLRAAWSKLEAYTTRFALIFQLCTWAAGEASAGNKIDECSMQSAIELSDWFANETIRVYRLFGESSEDQEQAQLVSLVQRKGGSISVRELMRSSRRFPKSIDAEEALTELTEAGYGTWVINRTSTNNSCRFVLHKALTLTDSPETAGIDEYVNVNGVDRPENTQ